jgi:hypothetical protein
MTNNEMPNCAPVRAFLHIEPVISYDQFACLHAFVLSKRAAIARLPVPKRLSAKKNWPVCATNSPWIAPNLCATSAASSRGDQGVAGFRSGVDYLLTQMRCSSSGQRQIHGSLATRRYLVLET